jgi:hypothetical protein
MKYVGHSAFTESTSYKERLEGKTLSVEKKKKKSEDTEKEES